MYFYPVVFVIYAGVTRIQGSPHNKIRAGLLSAYVICICRDSIVGFKQFDFKRKRKSVEKEWDKPKKIKTREVIREKRRKEGESKRAKRSERNLRPISGQCCHLFVLKFWVNEFDGTGMELMEVPVSLDLRALFLEWPHQFCHKDVPALSDFYPRS